MKNDLMTAHLAKFMVLKNLLNAKMRFIEQNTIYRGNDLSITNYFFSGQRWLYTNSRAQNSTYGYYISPM